MSRILAVAGLLALLVLVGACGGQAMAHARPGPGATPAPGAVRGTVTGSAAVCAPLVPKSQAWRVVVYAVRGQKYVARQVVPAGRRGAAGRYLLSLAPGYYVISAPDSGDPPAAITVRAGGTVRVGFPDPCHGGLAAQR